MSDSTKLTIPLQRLDDLFSTPVNDPYMPGYHIQSGIEQLITAVEHQNLRGEIQVVFVLPASGPRTEKTTADVQSAIRRYTEAILARSQMEALARRRSTWQNIGMGIVVLAVSLTLGATLTNAEFLSPGMRNLLANTVSILGTVALWSPVDALLFGLRPLRKTQRTMQTIRAATIELQYRDLPPA